jgi:Outer membrane lipoprotein-sorting protein
LKLLFKNYVNCFTFFIFTLTTFTTQEVLASSLSQLTAANILEKTDAPRGATATGVTWKSFVQSEENGKRQEKKYLVRVKGVNALAECLEPARCLGESILFSDLSLWYFKQGLKKPIPISGKQKLSGQAANGDIAATNYARDYDGEKVSEETISTDFLKSQKCLLLKLTAKNKSVTYDKIKYWVCEDNNFMFAAKAEFQTAEGVTLKFAEFEYKNTLANVGKFVSVMRIRDALTTTHKTDINYSEPVLEKHSNSIFNSNNFLR